jgi:hypothetical protein
MASEEICREIRPRVRGDDHELGQCSSQLESSIPSISEAAVAYSTLSLRQGNTTAVRSPISDNCRMRFSARIASRGMRDPVYGLNHDQNPDRVNFKLRVSVLDTQSPTRPHRAGLPSAILAPIRLCAAQ